MNNPTSLPAGFEALEPLVPDWVLPDSRARHARRLAADFGEIRRFYDTMLPQAPRILETLSSQRLGELDPPHENLLKLMLALAEVGPAVEWYQQPGVTDGFPAHRFELVDQLSDTAVQEAR